MYPHHLLLHQFEFSSCGRFLWELISRKSEHLGLFLSHHHHILLLLVFKGLWNLQEVGLDVLGDGGVGSFLTSLPGSHYRLCHGRHHL